MKADQTRSIRLNTLLKMALSGADESQLREKCMFWGVTKTTENSYIQSVVTRLKVMNR